MHCAGHFAWDGWSGGVAGPASFIAQCLQVKPEDTRPKQVNFWNHQGCSCGTGNAGVQWPANLVKKNFGRASHEESDPVSSPIDVLNHISQCRFLKE